MRRLWRFLKLQAVLWHSDYYTGWNRLKMRYEPVNPHLTKDELRSLVIERRPQTVQKLPHPVPFKVWASDPTHPNLTCKILRALEERGWKDLVIVQTVEQGIVFQGALNDEWGEHRAFFREEVPASLVLDVE